MGALEPIGLIIVGYIVKWIFDMNADRARKIDESDKHLATEENKLKDKVAELDKTNATAIATLTAGISHIVDELSGIRGDMKENRQIVFNRLDRNDQEIKEVKNIVAKCNSHLEVIYTKLGAGQSK